MYIRQAGLHIQVEMMWRCIQMKEEITYTVEREFLGKLTPMELIERIIQSHRQNEKVSKVG